MWYDEELEAKGFIQWDKSDLAEFGEIYEGKEFTLHSRKWIVVECSAFSSQCKIKRID